MRFLGWAFGPVAVAVGFMWGCQAVQGLGDGASVVLALVVLPTMVIGLGHLLSS